MEIRVRLPTGELAIPFSDGSDLEKKLSEFDVDRVIKLVSAKFAGKIEAQSSRTKPGLEGVYEMGLDGLPNLLQIPKSKIEAIGLALYVAAPRGLTGAELDRVSRVNSAVRGFVNQARYKKYFGRDEEGRVVLSHDGIRWVSETILPGMKGVK